MRWLDRFTRLGAAFGVLLLVALAGCNHDEYRRIGPMHGSNSEGGNSEGGSGY